MSPAKSVSIHQFFMQDGKVVCKFKTVSSSQFALNNLRRDLNHAESEKATAFFHYKRTGKDFYRDAYVASIAACDQLIMAIESFTSGGDD